MKRIVSYKSFLTMLLVVGLWNSTSHAVNWPPASNVTNENIVITKDVRMPRGTTTISATDSFDLVVSLDQSADIKGNECGDSTLDLFAEFGEGGASTILFDITQHSLTIRPQEKNENVIQRVGGGEVTFEVGNGHKLIFDAKK